MLAGKDFVRQAGERMHVVTNIQVAERVAGGNVAKNGRCRVQRHDVEQADFEICGDKDVFGRYLAVHHRFGVQELQGVANSPDDGQSLVQR